MRKRPWLIWLILVILLASGGVAIWMKVIADEQPQVHEDPGIPDVEVPDPEDVE